MIGSEVCQRHMLSAAMPIAVMDAKCPFGTGPAMPRSATPAASSTAAAASATPASASGSATARRTRTARSRSRRLEDLGALIVQAAGMLPARPDSSKKKGHARGAPAAPPLPTPASCQMTEAMLVLAQVAAAVLMLLPTGLALCFYARRDRALWHLAAVIPAAVALDILLVLVLCRVMRLEFAAFASRVVWVGGGAWMWWRARRRADGPAWPVALDRQALLGLGLAAVAAFALSLVLSRPAAIWDRELHIPLVSSLRGQRIPFANAFEPGQGLHYHFSGDVLAAMVQTFSFAVLNASLALSLTHDVLFALIALSLGLAMLGAGRKPPHLVVLGVVAVLLSGPCVLRFGIGEPYLGYNYYGFYNWAYRPHLVLELLML